MTANYLSFGNIKGKQQRPGYITTHSGSQTAPRFELSPVPKTANMRRLSDAPEVQDIICMVEDAPILG